MRYNTEDNFISFFYCMPGARSGPDSGKSGPAIRDGVLILPDQSVSSMDIAHMCQDVFIAGHVSVEILISNHFSKSGINLRVMELPLSLVVVKMCFGSVD